MMLMMFVQHSWLEDPDNPDPEWVAAKKKHGLKHLFCFHVLQEKKQRSYFKKDFKCLLSDCLLSLGAIKELECVSESVEGFKRQ